MQTFVPGNRPRLSRMFLTVLALTTILSAASSCSQKGPAATRVTVTGEASLKAQPDAAVIVLSVVTQDPQALNAQQENARKSDAVIHAVQDSAGTNVEIKTSDYSLQPQYDYRSNKLPKIVGYDARNSVAITTSDLNGVGKVIDVASRAGANSVERVSFILRENSPVRGQTLATATQQAMGKAESIAQAMGGRVLRVVEEQEGMPGRPGESDIVANGPAYALSEDMSLARKTIPTPVEAGSLNVRSQVHLIVEIEALKK
jgi:uncharacterized protein YggE